jgi:2,6-dihydroxypyridine 3-monooxygenase
MSDSLARVIVAGGSLGGLNAALWLREAGCEVEVFERSHKPLEGQGAGIVLNPATTRWFDEHGSDERVGVPARYVRYLDRDGVVAAELPHAYLFSSYDTLYRRLLAAFGREQCHLGEEVVSADAAGATVCVRLASGGARTADLLVWADGIRSAGRAQLLPDVTPRYAGYIAWRGTVEPARLRDDTTAALEDAITYCVLDHSHALTYPIPSADGLTINWLWYRNTDDLDVALTDRTGKRREVSVPAGAVPERRIAELRAAADEQLPAPLVDLVSQTAEPFLQAVFDIEVPRMAFQRQCLIGDAAFAARPHAAAGSAKAAEDGYRLACAIRDARGDVLAALAHWEPAQLHLGHGVLTRTREAGDSSQFHGSWMVGDPLPFGLYEVGDSIVTSA